MSSDEFHFFPQARSADHDWSRWDDFSPEAVQDVTRRLAAWTQDLDRCGAAGLSLDDRAEIHMLRSVIRTIREQLTDVSSHLTQPTFYLTILGIGVAESMDAGQQAMDARVSGLPRFIDQARRNLHRIPRIFRDLGCEMIQSLTPWLQSLQISENRVTAALDALNRLNGHLNRMSTTDDFLLPRGLYERVAFHHMGCGLHTDEIARRLDREMDEARSIMTKAAAQIAPGASFVSTIDTLPLPELPPGGVKQLYHLTINALADHCLQNGLVTSELVASCPVGVEAIPDYMLPVRSSAAFSMPPGYPPKGGTFFIRQSRDARSVSTDYRILTAHETFPGHHLLDTCRWRLKRRLRRHMEFPIFYEGWASFSEELLFDTGFFSTPVDRLLLGRRRFLRAIRGRVDLDIHTRKRNLDEAAMWLAGHGLDRSDAVAMVRRYALKPGYQLAYTLGRQRFRRLYDAFNEKSPHPVRFAHRVLAQGEIGFDDLERVLRK